MLALIALFGETEAADTALPALGITPITGAQRTPRTPRVTIVKPSGVLREVRVVSAHEGHWALGDRLLQQEADSRVGLRTKGFWDPES